MDRRHVLSLLIIGTCGVFSPIANAKKKGKGKGTKKEQKPKPQVKKLTGHISLSERGITKSYSFLADKPYTIAKSLHGKVKDLEGAQVTIFGTFFQNKVIKIDGLIK